MKLGSLTLSNNLILAPLQNVTTAPYRRFCRCFSEVGLVCVPMLYSDRLANRPSSVEHELHGIETEKPVSVQLITSDSETLKHAIEYLESYKFDVLDINAGCPSKRTINSVKGGYLIKDLRKLEEILTTSVKYSSRPVSLKTRTGFKSSCDINELAKIVNDSGIEFITVHARSVKSRFDDSALDLDFLRKLKELISIPLVGNGDIDSPKFAKYFLEYTNVDALMIGRSSMGNPEIFYQINEFLEKNVEIQHKNNLDLMKKNIILYEKIIDNFLEGLNHKFYNEKYKLMELRRNAIWLTKNIENSTGLRNKLSKIKNFTELQEVLQSVSKN